MVRSSKRKDIHTQKEATLTTEMYSGSHRVERKINTPGMRGGADNFSTCAGDYGKRLEEQGGGSSVKGITHQERHSVTLAGLVETGGCPCG